MSTPFVDPCSYEHNGSCAECQQPCASDQCRALCSDGPTSMPLYAEDLQVWLCELSRIDMVLRCKRQGRNGTCRQHSNLQMLANQQQEQPDLSNEASILLTSPTQWRTWLLLNTSANPQGWMDIVAQISRVPENASVGVIIRLALMIAGAMIELNPLDKLPLILRLPSDEERLAMDGNQNTNQRFVISAIVNVSNDAMRRTDDYVARGVPIDSVMPRALLDLANEPSDQ